MATVGDPGNPSVGVIQSFGGPKGDFVDPPQNKGLKDTGIYKKCSEAPAAPPPCLTVGGVGYTYGIGEFATTVSQYVTFLNTADPNGKNLHDLYNDDMSPTIWPKYGSVRYSAEAAAGAHYSVAYPEWANKPFNFGDFRRAIRFANSLTNGKVLSSTQSSSGAFKYTAYTVRLSPNTERGMYDLTNPATTRTKSTGFVLPSNNEWVKAAYYDPHHGGTDSYWAYPTDPVNPPNVSKLNPSTGDVLNASDQPLATYNPQDPNSSVDTPGGPTGAAPTWCPAQAGPSCSKVFPSDIPQGLDLPKQYMANVSTVGQTKSPSPWGTYDQGGNVVENLETLAPQPPGYNFLRNWRYYHGGVANAPAYQMEISAFGYNSGDPALERIYPWDGFRIGVIGNLK
jgi:formylglycine-generating enzyme required for sulfatase activity